MSSQVTSDSSELRVTFTVSVPTMPSIEVEGLRQRIQALISTYEGASVDVRQQAPRASYFNPLRR